VDRERVGVVRGWLCAVDGDEFEAPPERYLDQYRCHGCRRRIDAHSDGSCEGWLGLTPRFAWALDGALFRIGDWWLDDPELLDLPRAAVPLLVDRSFVEGMRASALKLARAIVAGDANEQMCSCLADEVNLAMALEDAFHQLSDSPQLLPSALDHPRGVDPVEDFFDAGQQLRADSDVDMLFNPALDGIEHEAAVLRNLGIDSGSLRPQRWFEPFWPVP
jgi:hypothetical protein